MKRSQIVLISMLVGLAGMVAFATREPWAAWQFFPFAASYGNDCTGKLLNPFNGCGYSYDPVMTSLDYLFWLGIAVIGVSVITVIWNKRSSLPASQ